MWAYKQDDRPEKKDLKSGLKMGFFFYLDLSDVDRYNSSQICPRELFLELLLLV